jgi:hypothetical protein
VASVQENWNNTPEGDPIRGQQEYPQQPADPQYGYPPQPPNALNGYGQGYYNPPQGSFNPQGNPQQYNPYGYNSPGVRDYLNGYNPKGKAVAGFVLGLTSFIGLRIPILGVVGAIVGIVLSTNGRHSSQRGVAIAGTVLSIIGLIVSIAAWIIYTVHNLSML